MNDAWADACDRLLDQADDVLDQGGEAEVRRLLRSVRSTVRDAEARDPKRALDLYYVLASAHTLLMEHERAGQAYQSIRRLAPNDSEIDYWEASSLFRRWRFDESREALKRCAAEGDLAPDVLWLQGLLTEFEPDFDAADRLFAKAHRMAPDRYPMPCRVPTKEAEAILRQVMDAMPDDVARALELAQVMLLPLPDPVAHRSPDVDPLVLGLYTGRSLLGTDLFSPGDLPDRVEVFQRNIERSVADRDELAHELRITLLHEIGHHLGWDEDDLDARGLG